MLLNFSYDLYSLFTLIKAFMLNYANKISFSQINMLTILRRLTTNPVNICKPTSNILNLYLLPAIQNIQAPRSFGILTSNQPFVSHVKSFLKPIVPTISFNCTYKIRGKPNLRCEDCYKVMRDGRLYVECKSLGRHKQTEMKKKPRTMWVLAQATQSKIRPW